MERLERRYHVLSYSTESFEVECRYVHKIPGKPSIYAHYPTSDSYYATHSSCLPCVVKDTETNDIFIIEPHVNTFGNILESKQLLAEARFGKICAHPNIHCVRDVMLPNRTSTTFDTVMFVKPHMDTSLYSVLCSKQELTINHAKYFLYQILCGINYLSSAGVVHQEICPRNILVNANCDLKIVMNNFLLGYCEDIPVLYSRQYKAPEEIFRAALSTDCPPNPCLDVWSAGCVFEEILNSAGALKLYSKFHYHCDGGTVSHLKNLCALLGRPSDEELDAEDSYFKDPRASNFLKSLPMRTSPPTMTELCPQFANEEAAADLLFRMLCFDPRKRISIKDALAHSFFDECRDIYVVDGNEGMNLETEAEAQFDLLACMTLDGLVEAHEPSYNGTAPNCSDYVKSLWWSDFYSRDPQLPSVHPGHADYVAEMNWLKRKSFLLFLYGFDFMTLSVSGAGTGADAALGVLATKVARCSADHFPGGVPFPLCAVFQNSDLVRYLLQFV